MLYMMAVWYNHTHMEIWWMASEPHTYIIERTCIIVVHLSYLTYSLIHINVICWWYSYTLSSDSYCTHPCYTIDNYIYITPHLVRVFHTLTSPSLQQPVDGTRWAKAQHILVIDATTCDHDVHMLLRYVIQHLMHWHICTVYTYVSVFSVHPHTSVFHTHYSLISLLYTEWLIRWDNGHVHIQTQLQHGCGCGIMYMGHAHEVINVVSVTRLDISHVNIEHVISSVVCVQPWECLLLRHLVIFITLTIHHSRLILMVWVCLIVF